MTYQTITRLAHDGRFIERMNACLTEQAMYFRDNTDPAVAALAVGILRDQPYLRSTFTGMVATAPGFAVAVELSDGTVDSALVPDVDLLAAVQADWPVVAGLYFLPDGTPRE